MRRPTTAPARASSSRTRGSALQSTCVPKTCAQQGFNCGPNGDTLRRPRSTAGPAPRARSAGTAGFSACGNPLVAQDGGAVCIPKTCADWGYNCGPAGDGCGNMLDCGPTTCPGTEFCGGGGPGKCGGDTTKTAGRRPGVHPADLREPRLRLRLGGRRLRRHDRPLRHRHVHRPRSSAAAAARTSAAATTATRADGGSTVMCAPKTCADLGYNCGTSGDGCGGSTGSCGTCSSPQFCGGGGAQRVRRQQRPRGRRRHHLHVPAEDVRGLRRRHVRAADRRLRRAHRQLRRVHQPEFCGGGGAPGKCGGNNVVGADGGVTSQCMPATCASLGYNCGLAADGCGGTIGPCGPTCVRPQSCGAGGKANVCGSNVPCTGLCTAQVALRCRQHDADRHGRRRNSDDVPAGGRHRRRSRSERPRLHPERDGDRVHPPRERDGGPAVLDLRGRRFRQPARHDLHGLRRHVHAHERARRARTSRSSSSSGAGGGSSPSTSPTSADRIPSSPSAPRATATRSRPATSSCRTSRARATSR